ncbi:MAG: bifunctional 2-methylcitrate dehydratase/aconitate hydratase [Opitutae bacterium]|nr:bifunctional 2-methylcitrate dehydratase/aconitate hydratase [Opitutae bacterium]
MNPPPALPAPDPLLTTIADYVVQPPAFGTEAYRIATHALLDALGCAMRGLQAPECSRLLGPVVPGTTMPLGARVPGTAFELDPVTAAFDLGCCIGWSGANDACLAAERSHPSDNLGALLAAADWMSRSAGHADQLHAFGAPLPTRRTPLTIHELLSALIQVYEIHGRLAQDNTFLRFGLDSVLLVRIASSAVVTRLLGGTHEQVLAALSHTWLDGSALSVYRHPPNQTTRQAWAAGDAASRAVLLSLRVLAGEGGCPTALTAPTWGFQDVVLQGRPLPHPLSLGSAVMEHALFKIASPAEIHAQTAVEAAIKLHHQVVPRLADVERVEIATHEAALRFHDRTGPLDGYTDRTHCLQYVTAVGLLCGRLTEEQCHDHVAADARLATLRERMHLHEDFGFSLDYRDPDKRSLANAVQVFFRDRTHTERIAIEYPVGHYRRRAEGLPLLFAKAEAALHMRFEEERAEEILDLFDQPDALAAMPVDKFLDLWVA